MPTMEWNASRHLALRAVAHDKTYALLSMLENSIRVVDGLKHFEE